MKIRLQKGIHFVTVSMCWYLRMSNMHNALIFSLHRDQTVNYWIIIHVCMKYLRKQIYLQTDFSTLSSPFLIYNHIFIPLEYSRCIGFPHLFQYIADLLIKTWPFWQTGTKRLSAGNMVSCLKTHPPKLHCSCIIWCIVNERWVRGKWNNGDIINSWG